MAFPADAHLDDPDDVLFRAVDVDAPGEVVFRWLCQLKLAPYSYDWIDNLGRRSPRELVPGVARLAVGQRFIIFTLVEFEPGRHITLVLRKNAAFGDVAFTYLVVPVTADRSRLVVKLLVRYPRTPVWGFAARRVLPAGDLIMMRRQLLTFKKLAEATARGEIAVAD